MNREFLFELTATIVISVIAGRIILPQLIKYSVSLKLVDIPNQRKVHRQPIPAIGGLVIALSLAIATVFSASLQKIFSEYFSLICSSAILLITGIFDDRMNLDARARLIVQLNCALMIATDGIRLQSLHGIAGINELPQTVQYILTVIIIAGVTNAFNLVDGIDGLAGSFAVINLSLLSMMAVLVNSQELLFLLLPIIGLLFVFLKYNWRPAKLFMGDGGSLLLGFLMVALSVLMSEKIYKQHYIEPKYFLVIISAQFIIPVVDTVRLFFQRLNNGKSPFSADRNHIHHWLIRNSLIHSQATKRLIGLHLFIIIMSALLVSFLSITIVIVLQVLMVLTYTGMLQFATNFARWYRFIKRWESI